MSAFFLFRFGDGFDEVNRVEQGHHDEKQRRSDLLGGGELRGENAEAVDGAVCDDAGPQAFGSEEQYHKEKADGTGVAHLAEVGKQRCAAAVE